LYLHHAEERSKTMTEDRIEQLAEKVKTTPCSPEDPRSSAGVLLLPAILRVLVEGQPASMETISQAIGLPPDLAVDGHLVAAGTVSYLFPSAEFEADGRLTGLGLSLSHTPHEVLLQGRNRVLYAWCALDALLLPTLVGENAHINSPCHATGQPVTVAVGPEDAERIQPSSAVVSFMTETDPEDLRASGCNNQHFFISAEAAAPWLAEHPQAFAVPVADACRVLIRLSEEASGTKTPGTVDIGEAMARLIHRQVVEEIACRLIAKDGDRFSTTSGQPEPGDMWWDPDLAGPGDSEAHRARGGGAHLVVRLPNDVDWDIDGPMINGPGWHRTGEPPNITVMPSFVAWECHGFLLKGKLLRID
jgi:alkylmercury lyase